MIPVSGSGLPPDAAMSPDKGTAAAAAVNSPAPPTAAGGAGPGSSGGPGPPPGEGRSKRVLTIVGGVAAAAAAGTSVIAFIQSQVEDPPPPERITASIRSVEYDGRQPLGDWIASTGQPTEGIPAEELREEGLVFAVEVRITGSVGRRLPLKYSVYDVQRGRRLRGRLYNQTAVSFEPDAVMEGREVPVWIPLPPRAGSYEARFILADPRGKYSDGARSRPIRVRDVPRG